MESLHINLIAQYKQNFLRIAMGLVMLLLSAYTIFNSSESEGTLQTYLPVFIIAGIGYIIIGIGINPISLFGKAYIKIDKASIEVKPNVFNKPWSIEWKNIEQIQIKVASIRFIKGETTTELPYGRMSEVSVLELKTAIIGIAKEKNIDLS